MELDWYETKLKSTGETMRYTVAHWCTTEARFRNHLKKIKPEAAEKLIHLDNMLVRITQQDVVYRRYLDPEHRSFIPDFGVYIKYEENGKIEYRALSRQLVHVLRRTPQGLAHAAEQGRRREQGIHRAEGDSRGRGCRQDSAAGADHARARAGSGAAWSAGAGESLITQPSTEMENADLRVRVLLFKAGSTRSRTNVATSSFRCRARRSCN